MRRAFPFLFLLFTIGTLSAQEKWVPGSIEERFHPQEGLPWFMKDARPDSLDVLHYDVRIGRPDREEERLDGECRIRAVVQRDGLEAFPFDLAGFDVEKVEADGEEIEYRREGDSLWVEFSEALSKGDSLSLRVLYGGKPVIDPSGWGGTYFRNGYVFNLGVGFKAKPHSYGRTWFPCVDHFRERASYSFRVVAPEGEKAVCSGTLEEVTRVEGGKAWSWELEKQVPPYLVSFVVGDLATLHREYETRDGRTVPIRLDVPPEDSSDAIKSFSHLKDALNTFEKRFGPYRWPRVGYVAVPFPNGAMEHATNIAYPQASVNGTHASDDLMAHELAHAWWGNLVTCATPWDMWINEGMASFSEFLFQEGLNGKEAYREAVRRNHKRTLRSAHLQDGNEHRAVYGIPHAYTYGSHVYDKGADMLRTIRYMMPDSLFFASLRKILKENAYSNMPTHRLVEEWQEHSGRPIETWAEDLLLKPGFPHFEVEQRMYKEKDGKFRVELVLKQRGSHSSDRYGPMPVEILLRGENGEEEIREVRISKARKNMSFQVPFDPVVISADPGGGLATATLTDTATIDPERVVETGRGGVIEFEHTEMKLKVEEGSTPFFVQSKQHYVVPGMKGVPDELRGSEARFWSLDGTYPADSSVSFSFEVDGQQKKGVHPEIHFFDKMEPIDEEELAVLYRPKGKDVWQRLEASRIRTGKSPSDGKARIEVHKGVKGDLLLAAPSE